MDQLSKFVLDKGIVIDEDILKVDSFLNHQVDMEFMNLVVDKFYQEYKDKKIDKIITLEVSGIAPATLLANKLNVPLVIVKKQKSLILKDNVYSSNVKSFTKNKVYEIFIDKNYLLENENILILDDFLANGQAALGLVDLCKQANANVVSIGIVIEKTFQKGGNLLKEQGFDVFSAIKIASLKNNKITLLDGE